MGFLQSGQYLIVFDIKNGQFSLISTYDCVVFLIAEVEEDGVQFEFKDEAARVLIDVG